MTTWVYAAVLVAAALLTLAGFLAFWRPGPPINREDPPATVESWMWEEPPPPARRPRHRWENLEQRTRRLEPPKDPPDWPPTNSIY